MSGEDFGGYNDRNIVVNFNSRQKVLVMQNFVV